MIVEVDWVDDGTVSYADRTVESIPGRIVGVSDLDDVVNVGGNGDSQQLSVTLSDTDGAIKSILDTHDVHKRRARVYQYFAGLALTDKFLLFDGTLSTPISWDERKREVTITILTQLEDREIGFSAEEGAFEYLPADMVNKPWPLIFGKVLNNKCLGVSTAISGTTLTPVGILAGENETLELPVSFDVDFEISIYKANTYLEHLKHVVSCWETAPARLTDEADADYALRVSQYAQTAAQYEDEYDECKDNLEQQVAVYQGRRACTLAKRQKKIDEANIEGLGPNPIKILGGEDFPQNQTVTISIEGGLFTGYFNGTDFHCYKRTDEELIEKAEAAYNSKLNDPDPAVCGIEYTTLVNQWSWVTDVPEGRGSIMTPGQRVDTHTLVVTLDEQYINDRTPVIQQFWVEPGATATLYLGETKSYIVSITPGTVLSVRAFKQVSTGLTRLVDVPNDLYTVVSRTYGTVTAVMIDLERPLSHILGEGWQDDLYVSFESSIGPNVAEIIEYIVEEYTDLTCDSSTFTAVGARLEKFPANFAINDRRNVVQVLQEIAFQARCAIWFSEGVVYLRYLPEEPTPVDTITEDDIDAEAGIIVSLTATEELVTKMVANWSLRVETEDQPFSVTLRHNVKKYGVHESAYNYYIYNQPDIIYKIATFWLIRKSNTWKRISFTTHAHKLNLETFDAVTLDFDQSYVASGPIVAIVESAAYNSADNTIQFTCLTPVAAGTLVKYPYYWPADLAATVTWPSAEDIETGYAGAGGVGSGASGALPVGDTSTIQGAVFIGGQNVVFGPNSDYGDRTPTDTGFVAKDTVTTSHYTSSSYKTPSSDRTVDYADKMTPIAIMRRSLKSDVALDIHATRICDSSTGVQREATLADLIKRVNETGRIVVNGDVLIGADDVEKPFDFKYVEAEGEKMGAGTAFLEEDE
jgi:hypothetical protein